MYIIRLTSEGEPMANRKPRDMKEEALRERGSWNAGHRRVAAPSFGAGQFLGFFDPRDVVQVKYEMLRLVRVEGKSVKVSAAIFGFSRPAFYNALAALAREGLAGLLPHKRGPRGGHKLTEEVMAFVEDSLTRTSSLRPAELAAMVEGRFGVRIHARSIERALRRRGKKRR